MLTDEKDAEKNEEKKVDGDGEEKRKKRTAGSLVTTSVRGEEQYVRLSSDTNYVFETSERS